MGGRLSQGSPGAPRADKGWQGYLAKVLPLIQTMESKILVPAAFSPKP